METDDEWSPYLTVEDAYKFDDVREALKNGDTSTAARYGRVFSLTPIAIGPLLPEDIAKMMVIPR